MELHVTPIIVIATAVQKHLDLHVVLIMLIYVVRAMVDIIKVETDVLTILVLAVMVLQLNIPLVLHMALTFALHVIDIIIKVEPNV